MDAQIGNRGEQGTEHFEEQTRVIPEAQQFPQNKLIGTSTEKGL